MLRQLSIEEVCRKLKPIFGKRIDDIYLKYAMADSHEEKEEIFQMLNASYHKNLGELLDNKVLLEPPKSEMIDGNYPLAKVSYAGQKLFDFKLRESDWSRHVCISGMSGSGKTTFALNILNNFISHDKPFLVFDWKKSFRSLLLASPEVMCFTVGNCSVSNFFRMNINEPPKGIDPKEWINILCDLLTESFCASFGVHKVLLETLDKSFKEWGVYDGSENYPTWNHIKWYLEQKAEKVNGREGGWIESALRIASVLTFGNFGKVCNSKEEGHFGVEDLLDKKVILELNSLSSIEKKFFCEFVLTYIYKLKKARQKNVGRNFDHAILVDEAHNIFLKSGTHFAKESVTDMIYREMREYGTSLICLDQHVSKLSDTVKGNSACNIAFQQQLPADIMDISAIMQLKEQREFFSMLPIGSAIVKLSERYTAPFLIEVSPMDLRGKFVTDNDVKNRTGNLVMAMRVMKGSDSHFKDELMQGKTLESADGVVVVNRGVGDSLKSENSSKLMEVERAKKESADVQSEINLEKFGYVNSQIPDFSLGQNVFHDNSESEDNLQTGGVSGGQNLLSQSSNLVLDESLNEDLLMFENHLTARQKVLYEFIVKGVDEGRGLREIEKLLEDYKDEGGYSLRDVGVAVNYFFENKFNQELKGEKNDAFQTVATGQIQKVYKGLNIFENRNLGPEEKKFLTFLLENQDRRDGTVAIYKTLGFSSRRGNEIKKALLDKNLIRIDEQRSNKGWKKIIKLSVQLESQINSY